MIPITIAIPVGPKEHHRKWLNECVESILSQCHDDDDVFLVFDGPVLPYDVPLADERVRMLVNPITLGVSASVNLSVGHAGYNLVLLMNSDDKLLPGALDALRQAWLKHMDMKGWYYLNTLYSDGNEQKSASGVAMVYRQHFIEIGGYPPETAVGFPDWMFLSLMQHRGLIHPISVSDECLHWHRVHENQETKVREVWRPAGAIVHEILLKTWQPPGGK